MVPWQQVAKQTGAVLRYFSLTKEGELDLEAAEQTLTEKAKIVSINHASNVLGTVTDVKRVAEMVHAVGGVLVVDGAQAAPHQRVNVQELDCDFYAFSGHKMLAPTGIWRLIIGKEALSSRDEPCRIRR